MNHLCATVIVMFTCLAAFAGNGKESWSIRGKVTGIKDTTILLAYHFGDKQYIKDTALVDSQGQFEFKGEDKIDGGIYLIVPPNKPYFEIIVPGQEKIKFRTDTVNSVMNMVIEESEENKLFYDYLKFIHPRGEKMEDLRKSFEKANTKQDSTEIREKMTALDKEVAEYKKNVMATNPGTFVAKMFKAMQEIEVPDPPKDETGKVDSLFKYRYYKEHFFDNIDFSDDRLLRTPIYHNKLKQFFESVVIQIPDSINKEADKLTKKAEANSDIYKYTVWFITNHFERSKVMGMDAVFVHMGENYYMKGKTPWVDSTTLAKITERVIKTRPNLIGKIAPELLLQDTLVRNVSLHKVPAKYTVLYFWSYSCGHCKKVTPLLHDTYKKYKKEGVEVFAVCTEYDVPEWKKFIKEHKLSWINAMDMYNKSNFRNLYDIYSTPVVYILDDKKEIIAKRLGVEQVEEVLEHKLHGVKPTPKPHTATDGHGH